MSYHGTRHKLQTRKLELRALQRQVLELETFASPTYGVEVKSFDGEPIAASFVSWAGKSSDIELLDVGLNTQNGVDLAARKWKLLLGQAVCPDQDIEHPEWDVSVTLDRQCERGQSILEKLCF